jgi:hypothetical protein
MLASIELVYADYMLIVLYLGRLAMIRYSIPPERMMHGKKLPTWK